MKKYVPIVVFVLAVGVCAASEWHSIDLTVSVDPQKVMTADERHEFGIEKFSPQQTKDFKLWLSHYALDLANQFQAQLNKQVDEAIKELKEKK